MPIIEIEANTPEWLSLRKHYIGASDVAALFGVSRYNDYKSLWEIKAGVREDTFKDNPNTIFGRECEPAIAKVVEFNKKWKTQKFRGFVAHDSIKGMGCTPDYEILDHEKGKGILELKSVGYDSYRKNWLEAQPPADFQLQVMHQLACCRHLGYTWVALAAWISGQYLVVKEYDLDEGVIQILEQGVRDFWKSIEQGIRPLKEAA